MVARQGNNQMRRRNMMVNRSGNMRQNFKPQNQQNQMQNRQFGGGFKPQGQMGPRNHQNRNNQNTPNLGNLNLAAAMLLQQQNQLLQSASQMMDNPGYLDFNEPRQSFSAQKGNKNMQNQNAMNRNMKNNNRNNNNNIGRRNSYKLNNTTSNGNMGNNSNNNNAINNQSGQMSNFPNNNQRNNLRNNNNNSNMNVAGNMNHGGQRFHRNNNQNAGNMSTFNGMNNGINSNNNMNGSYRNQTQRMPFPNQQFDNSFGGSLFNTQGFARPSMLPPMQMMNRSTGNRQINRRVMPANPMNNGNAPFRGNGPRGLAMRRKLANAKSNVANAKGQRTLKKSHKNQTKNGRKMKGGRRNQTDRYQLNKPWVTDEIKAAHEKKVELANQLKGNKNDELFAEFKTKRDEFIKLYDAARIEYNKNKAKDKKAESENDNQTNNENSENNTESTAAESAATDNAANDTSVEATS